ncbi:MAG: sigma-70 family RNA polymerase sigma factor [Ruminococcus sp.]|nr:sigma-70 family RNA polymerase sigma factor [Ruminococcus sp.]
MADFERIFEENRGFIYKYLFKMCRNHTLAEELTQETFFRAYMNISNLKKEDKASLWLCSIAKNTYFAFYNEQKKLEPLENSVDAESPFDTVDILENKELAQKAFSVLHSLEEPYKDVFMLSVFAGLSLKEISSLFGKSESWARVTFYRAKQRITERMR